MLVRAVARVEMLTLRISNWVSWTLIDGYGPRGVTRGSNLNWITARLTSGTDGQIILILISDNDLSTLVHPTSITQGVLRLTQLLTDSIKCRRERVGRRFAVGHNPPCRILETLCQSWAIDIWAIFVFR